MLLKFNHHTKLEKTWKKRIATGHVLPRRRTVRGIKPLGDDQLSLNIYYHHPLVIHDSIHLVQDREYQQNFHYKLETTWSLSLRLRRVVLGDHVMNHKINPRFIFWGFQMKYSIFKYIWTFQPSIMLRVKPQPWTHLSIVSWVEWSHIPQQPGNASTSFSIPKKLRNISDGVDRFFYLWTLELTFKFANRRMGRNRLSFLNVRKMKEANV